MAQLNPRSTMLSAFLLLLALFVGSACGDKSSSNDFDETADDDDTSDVADDDATNDDETNEEETPWVGYEILEIHSPTEIVVWLSTTLTTEEFESIELPEGWAKNQPREGEPDLGVFARSPDAEVDGEFTNETLFDYDWRHVATITETNILLDEEGLLTANKVAKFHTVTFLADKFLKVLVAPEGDQYVRISRDAGRVTDDPTIPSTWSLVDYVTPEELVIELPPETLVIRSDNEDSFQGPIPPLDVGQ